MILSGTCYSFCSQAKFAAPVAGGRGVDTCQDRHGVSKPCRPQSPCGVGLQAGGCGPAPDQCRIRMSALDTPVHTFCPLVLEGVFCVLHRAFEPNVRDTSSTAGGPAQVQVLRRLAASHAALGPSAPRPEAPGRRSLAWRLSRPSLRRHFQRWGSGIPGYPVTQ